MTSSVVRQPFGRDHQRVVAHGLERRGNALEDGMTVMGHLVVLPCMSRSARTTRPPNASPMAWWPRQTPSTGTRPAAARTSGTEMPASRGVQGPGEITIASGRSCERGLDAQGIVPVDYRLGAQLAGVLDEVVGEAVVVVEDEEHRSEAICGSELLRQSLSSPPPGSNRRSAVLAARLDSPGVPPQHG